MPDLSPEKKKTALKVAMGAALGGALGITAALRNRSDEQRAMSNEENATAQSSALPQSSVLMPPKGHPQSFPRPQSSPDHPDWETLPTAHLPRPTYWPVVLAVGVMFLAWGIVTTIIISIIGVALLALGLGGWIGELRHGR